MNASKFVIFDVSLYGTGVVIDGSLNVDDTEDETVEPRDDETGVGIISGF